MVNNTWDNIENLEYRIRCKDYIKYLDKTDEWGGADVIIKKQLDEHTREWLKKQPIVISNQEIVPQRRVIITNHSKELSWLFYELKKIFSGQIDYVSKYDFYGSLAETASEYLNLKQKNQDLEELLLEVVQKSKEFAEK